MKTETKQMLAESLLTIVTILPEAAARIPRAEKGMAFVVDKFSNGASGGRVAHVRDYRFTDNPNGYQIWSISSGMYEIAYVVAL